MGRSISAATALLLFWLLLSGMFVPFLVTAGIGSAIAVTLLARRMDVIDREGHPSRMAWFAVISYWPWLIKEIILSGWTVTKLILHPKLPISPALVEFTPTQTTDLGLVVHANSITLTPGTIAIEVESGRMLVHALTQDGADGLQDSEMDRRCSDLESRQP